jgi:archaellum component FlaG (FlaF/FlaG flagellin family)
VIGNIVSRSATVTLALWDDAVEDGDSISLRINGKWVAQGFPVKKNPQFLQVTLNPGPNTITFVADNLGSIPPNTSVLEIIDGKKRKSFNIETNLDQNNLVNIFYEVKQD